MKNICHYLPADSDVHLHCALSHGEHGVEELGLLYKQFLLGKWGAGCLGTALILCTLCLEVGTSVRAMCNQVHNRASSPS